MSKHRARGHYARGYTVPGTVPRRKVRWRWCPGRLAGDKTNRCMNDSSRNKRQCGWPDTDHIKDNNFLQDNEIPDERTVNTHTPATRRPESSSTAEVNQNPMKLDEILGVLLEAVTRGWKARQITPSNLSEAGKLLTLQAGHRRPITTSHRERIRLGQTLQITTI